MDEQQNLPAEFRNEGEFVKILADSTFMEQVSDVGIPQFEQDSVNLVGHSNLATTGCVDEELIQFVGVGVPNALPDRGQVTCFHREPASEVDCIPLVVGAVNPNNYVFASQTNTHLLDGVARTPVVTYEGNNLVFCPPSQHQVAFSQLPEGERRNLVNAEKMLLDKKLKKFKKLKRDKRV